MVHIRQSKEEEKLLDINTGKKSKTTNVLFLTDNQGLPLAMSEPIKGKYNDLFKLDFFFTRMLEDLELATIKTNDLFLNAGAGFDSKEFKALCFERDIIPNIDFNKRNSKALIIRC
jgi:hypothetical protein